MNKTVIGVRFKDVGKVYYFDPGDVQIEVGEGVIVETVRGVEFGEVVLPSRDIDEDKIVKPLKSIIRKADEKDYSKLESNKKKEEDAFRICQEKIKPFIQAIPFLASIGKVVNALRGIYPPPGGVLVLALQPAKLRPAALPGGKSIP